MLRAARFLRRFFRPDPGSVRVEEVRLPVGAGEVDALLYLPRRAAALPGWIALHGITVTGRQHPALVRFGQALAGAGCAVLVPDVPQWRALQIDLDAATETIAGAAAFLAARPEVRDAGIGVAGFSFGGTQALIASTEPHLQGVVRTVASFGGYCDLARSIRFAMTGEHEWQGVQYRLEPDPYGRWIMGANYLTRAPGYTDMEPVAAGLRELAIEAGMQGIFAGEAVYDARKAEIRAALPAEQRPVWDAFAHPASEPPPDPALARALAVALAAAAAAAEPRGDVRRVLPRLRCRVALAHGYNDTLIPFTETLRLRALMPPHIEAYATIIRSFAHSTDALRVHPFEYAREAYRFFRLLTHTLDD